MAKLKWDESGERFYELGCSCGVYYPLDASQNKYGEGVAWNGLTAFTPSPSGAEETKLWADDIKYASLRAAEDFGYKIEAYMYPDEFAQSDGSAEVAPGVTIGQQERKPFGFSCKTKIGNDQNPDAGYKLHIIWNSTASPSEKNYTTMNDNPDAITFSWDCTTNPVPVTGHKPTAYMAIDSTKVTPENLKKVEDKLYGDDASGKATLPTPDEIIALVSGG